ncbi:MULTISPECIES: hypothetical protein [unclassified Roseovarius]|uniref:hypothetical protein n=1 Tax=unclassified Roseovarius TaxID=2614913 RepID=UPI0034A0CBF7
MLSELPLPTKAQRQDARKCAVKVQLRLHALAARGHRRDHALVDHSTDRLARVALAIRLGQLSDERLDPRMIALGHLRVDAQRGVLGGGGGEVGLQLLLSCLQLRHAVLDAVGRCARQNGVDQQILILDHLGQLLLLDRAVIGLRRGQAVALGDVFLDEGLDQGRIHQMP